MLDAADPRHPHRRSTTTGKPRLGARRRRRRPGRHPGPTACRRAVVIGCIGSRFARQGAARMPPPVEPAGSALAVRLRTASPGARFSAPGADRNRGWATGRLGRATRWRRPRPGAEAFRQARPTGCGPPVAPATVLSEDSIPGNVGPASRPVRRRLPAGTGVDPNFGDRHGRGHSAGRTPNAVRPGVAAPAGHRGELGGPFAHLHQWPGVGIGVRSPSAGSVGGRSTALGAARIVVQAVLDDLERQEVLSLLTEHPAQALHILLVELPVARRRSLGIDQTLALQGNRILEMVTSGNSWRRRVSTSPMDRIATWRSSARTRRATAGGRSSTSFARGHQVHQFELSDLYLVAA